ncbi:MAG TPA: phosphotransferase family protein [Acidimicrobiales bacterium]|nr:phosphotransferase family protein [Acidimicrobiales bacterium]
MGVLERDPDATAAVLARWLDEVAGVEHPTVTDVSIPGSTGWSNETVLFEATWGSGGPRRARRLVARIAPSGHRVFPDDTFARQHAVMRGLAERSAVPMARIHWLEPDPTWFGRPFWVMDHVAGDIPSDAPPYAGGGWIHDATVDQQAQVWWSGVDAMARIHGVDVAGLGLPAGTLPADGTLDGHLDHYERYLAWGEDGEPYDLGREALAVLRRDRPPEPPEGTCLIWGDSRLSNLVYRDFEVAAVLDWEMCGLGDPLQDLGYWLFADQTLTTGSGCTRLPGFPSAAETAARWSATTGRSTEALPYYLLFAGFRFTVIMLRMGALLAETGFVGPEFARDNLVSQGLAELLSDR